MRPADARQSRPELKGLRGLPDRSKTCMLTQVADGVLVHQSELIQNDTVVVQGRAGVVLVDPGIQRSEMVCLANDLRELGQPVVAGRAASTHQEEGRR